MPLSREMSDRIEAFVDRSVIYFRTKYSFDIGSYKTQMTSDLGDRVVYHGDEPSNPLEDSATVRTVLSKYAYLANKEGVSGMRRELVPSDIEAMIDSYMIELRATGHEGWTPEQFDPYRQSEAPTQPIPTPVLATPAEAAQPAEEAVPEETPRRPPLDGNGLIRLVSAIKLVCNNLFGVSLESRHDEMRRDFERNPEFSRDKRYAEKVISTNLEIVRRVDPEQRAAIEAATSSRMASEVTSALQSQKQLNFNPEEETEIPDPPSSEELAGTPFAEAPGPLELEEDESARRRLVNRFIRRTETEDSENKQSAAVPPPVSFGTQTKERTEERSTVFSGFSAVALIAAGLAIVAVAFLLYFYFANRNAHGELNANVIKSEQSSSAAVATADSAKVAVDEVKKDQDQMKGQIRKNTEDITDVQRRVTAVERRATPSRARTGVAANRASRAATASNNCNPANLPKGSTVWTIKGDGCKVASPDAIKNLLSNP